MWGFFEPEKRGTDMSRFMSTAAPDRVASLVDAATAAAEDETASPAERAEVLMEVAMGLQQRPRTPAHLYAAVDLYENAQGLCPASDRLLQARITARKGTALQALPEEGYASLEAARAAYQAAIPILAEIGRPEELAEAEMNLGLVIQHLAGIGRARLTDAIAAYQRSLRTFDRRRFPVEFAILQNNLATAFLSIPFTDERARMREALAVQAFEDGLKVVNLIEHPLEYAMLQNNLGNALQYVSSSHVVENSLRALDAYDEALKVRTRERSPLEYASTIANKANCLRNLRGDPSRPENGETSTLVAAQAYYREAREIFDEHGDTEKATIAADALIRIEQDLLASAPRADN
jgi:tetratricopeptide (TPR) repeat protein